MEIISEPVTLEAEAQEPEAVPVTVTVEPESAVRSRGRPKGAPNKPRAQPVQVVIPEPVEQVPVAPVAHPRPKRAARAVAARAPLSTSEVPSPASAHAPSLQEMLSMLAQALSDQKTTRSQQRREMYHGFLP